MIFVVVVLLDRCIHACFQYGAWVCIFLIDFIYYSVKEKKWWSCCTMEASRAYDITAHQKHLRVMWSASSLGHLSHPSCTKSQVPISAARCLGCLQLDWNPWLLPWETGAQTTSMHACFHCEPECMRGQNKLLGFVVNSLGSTIVIQVLIRPRIGQNNSFLKFEG